VTHEQRANLEAHLASDDPDRVAYAKWVLRRATTEPDRVVIPKTTDADKALVNSCRHRECRTGCQRSVCHAGRGDHWGQVTMPACVLCVRSAWFAFES